MNMQTNGSQPVFIHALGRFEILINGALLRFVFKAPRKPLDLLKGLLTSGGGSVGQHTLCEALWPDLDSWSASRALNTAVFRLRALLGSKTSIRVDCGQLRLEPSYCRVDAWEFESGLASAADPDALLQALLQYGGAFLGDSEHPLALETRRRLQRKYLRGLLQLGQGYERCGNFGSAIDLYNRGLDVDGTAEELHSALISCLERAGQAAAAAAAFQRCSAVFKNRLAAPPASSGWTVELARLFRTGR
jgi:LuxR family transcriptional regulator, maltose regulon positive regulatory protein